MPTKLLGLALAALLVAPRASSAANEEADAKALSQALAADEEVNLKAWTELVSSLGKPGACDEVHKATTAALKAVLDTTRKGLESRKKLLGAAPAATASRAEELSRTRLAAHAAKIERAQEQALEKLTAFGERCPKQATALSAEVDRLGELFAP